MNRTKGTQCYYINQYTVRPTSRDCLEVSWRDMILGMFLNFYSFQGDRDSSTVQYNFTGPHYLRPMQRAGPRPHGPRYQDYRFMIFQNYLLMEPKLSSACLK